MDSRPLRLDDLGAFDCIEVRGGLTDVLVIIEAAACVAEVLSYCPSCDLKNQDEMFLTGARLLESAADRLRELAAPRGVSESRDMA